jgi:RimJ/RimL family protein N-acetyltransferase
VIATGPRETGDRDVRLREITLDDAPDLYRWRMDDTSRPMFRSTEPVPYETHLEYVRRYFDPANTDRWFVIEEYGAPVGSIVLYDIDAARGEAQWGRLVIAPELRSRGLASRGLSLLVRHARALGLHRLRCEVLEGNAHADRIYRKAGFQETGTEESGGRRFVQLALDLDASR